MTLNLHCSCIAVEVAFGCICTLRIITRCGGTTILLKLMILYTLVVRIGTCHVVHVVDLVTYQW